MRKEFWNWFTANNHKYKNISQLENINKKEQLLEEFESELHKYCEHISFYIGGHPGGEQELVITAQGNTDYFEAVEKLIDHAPDINGWHFIKFKPGLETEDHFISEWENVSINTRDLFFESYTINETNDLGLKIYLKSYDTIADTSTLANQVCNIVETIIGEKAFAYDIKYLDIDGYPKETEPNQKIYNIFKLPELIQWYYNNFN